MPPGDLIDSGAFCFGCRNATYLKSRIEHPCTIHTDVSWMVPDEQQYQGISAEAA
jgi:hypothetical protein